MKEQKLWDVLRSAVDAGPRAAAYRALWEMGNRSGLREILEPVAAVPSPSDLPSFSEWSRDWPAGSWWAELRTDGPPPDDDCRARAEGAVHGRFRMFDAFDCNFGEPPDFWLEPTTGNRWPKVHSSRVLESIDEVGDPRTTWEPNRFGHVWDWIAVYRHDRDPKWPRAFSEQRAHWMRTNLFRRGINWASGQELALRAIAWLAGAAAFGDVEGMERVEYRRLLKMLYWHGHHIRANLAFARIAVPNNHLLAEALALALLGDLFAEYREQGVETFREGLRAQFRDDGGYCQNSHNYHRYALQLVACADRAVPELRNETAAVLQASRAYFAAMAVTPGSDVVPNFGPNDGAMLRPFRGAERGGEPTRSSFPDSGLHVLRRGPWAVFFRCGAPSRRGGHADQLHLDVWHDGEPVAVDAGSFRYTDPLHSWFAGTASHNTVTVDGLDQMRLVGRFTWVGECRTTLDEFDPARGVAVGTCEAYASRGILHEREVELHHDELVVIDRLSPLGPEGTPHDFRLHWLLPIESSHVQPTATGAPDCFTWNISLPTARVEIRALPLAGSLVEAAVVVEPSATSPAYGVREDATSLIALAVGPGVRFETTIRPR